MRGDGELSPTSVTQKLRTRSSTPQTGNPKRQTVLLLCSASDKDLIISIGTLLLLCQSPRMAWLRSRAEVTHSEDATPAADVT